MSKLRNRRKLRRRQRLETDRLIRQRRRRIRKLDRQIKELKDTYHQAKTDEERDGYADRIEVLKSRRKATRRDLAILQRRLTVLGRAIRRLAKRIQEAMPKPGQLTKDFHIREFDTKDNTPVPSMKERQVQVLCENILQPLRNRFGPCSVTSGYRHQAYNARIGGASRSFHIYDLYNFAVAADVVFARGNPELWAAAARELGAGGIGIYNGMGFLHVDTRDLDGFGRSEWRG